VHLGAIEVELLPFGAGHLGGAQPIVIGHQDHQRIAGAIAVAAGGLDQLFDFGESPPIDQRCPASLARNLHAAE
jgi:hypothetical protein